MNKTTRSMSGLLGLAAVLLAATNRAVLAQGGLPAWIGPPEGSVMFGYAVAVVADVDGDDVQDFVITDPGYVSELGRVGRVRLYSGVSRQSRWHADGPYVLDDRDLYQRQTWSIVATSIDDFDGDEVPDILVGWPAAKTTFGAVNILSGRTGESVWEETGPAEYEYFGTDVTRLGDLDGDEVSEFCILSRYDAWICSGATAETLHFLESMDARRVRNAGDLDGDLVPDIVFGTTGIRIRAISGATFESIWVTPRPYTSDTSFGYTLAAGHDLDGDGTPDLITPGSRPGSGTCYRLSGTTGEAQPFNTDWQHGSSAVYYVATADVNGDARVDPIVGWGSHLPPYEDYLSYRVFDHVPSPEPIGMHVYTVDGHPSDSELFYLYGNEFAAGDISGDGCADFVMGGRSGLHNRGILIVGGAPLLFGFDAEVYAAHGERDVYRGYNRTFAVYGDAPGRPVRLAVSRRGNGCTFIPQLGICIDLDRPFQQIGQAVTGADGFARFSVTISPNAALGPAWLQCLDFNFPGRGPTTSNVMRVEIVE